MFRGCDHDCSRSGHHVEEPREGGHHHPGHALPTLALGCAPGVFLEGKTMLEDIS